MADTPSNRAPLTAWGGDVALRGPEAPKNDGSIKHLIEYLLTVYERFGNTTVTVDLQWGATALWKRDEQKNRIAELEAELAALRSAPSENKRIEDVAVPCGRRWNESCPDDKACCLEAAERTDDKRDELPDARTMLEVLVGLKQLKRKIEDGTATPQEDGTYRLTKEGAWEIAERVLAVPSATPSSDKKDVPTPRTDAKAHTFQRECEVGSMGERYWLTHEVVDAEFARQLERELAEARRDLEDVVAEAERLEKRAFGSAPSATRRIEPDEYKELICPKCGIKRPDPIVMAWCAQDGCPDIFNSAPTGSEGKQNG